MDASALRDADPHLCAPAQDGDIANGYRFFFGRDPESPEAVADKRGASRGALIAQLLDAAEFEERFARPVLDGRHPTAGQFAGPPARDLLLWAAGFLPLEDAARARLVQAPGWAAAQAAVFGDARLRSAFPELSERLPLDAFVVRLHDMASDQGRRAPVGEIEGATAQVVHGHALDRNAPEEVLGVELWIDGRFAAATRADRPHAALQARYGGSGRHGFAFEGFAPPRPEEERTLRLELRVAGSRSAVARGGLEWRPMREASHLAALAEELRAARKALAAIERTLALVSGAMGFTPQTYDAYRRAYYVRTPAQAARETQEMQGFAWRPRIEVVVTGAAADRGLAEATLAGVDGQVYPPQATTLWLDRLADAFAPSAGIDYVVTLDAGDALAPDALHRLAAQLQDGPRPALVTWDSDTAEPDRHRDPVLRSAFDYDLLLQAPYIGPTAAVRVDALGDALARGGSLEPSARGDLWLRVVEAAGAASSPDAVRHLPRILLHRRPGEVETAYAPVVRAHLERAGSGAQILAADGGADGSPRLHVAWPLPAHTRAAVIVPTRDRLDLIGPCLASLEASRASNRVEIELLVVDNASAEPGTRRTLDALALSGRVRVLRYDDAFNWSAINNFAAAATRADVLVFLNNDTIVLTPGWCDALCAQALRPEVGAVGARLLYEDGTIQHAGIVLGTAQALAAHEGVGAPADDDGYLGRRGLAHRAAAVTGACLATRREVFERLGGFDAAELAVEANDIDYALRVRRDGLAVIYEPAATLYHFESRSRGHTDADGERRRSADRQLAALERRWGDDLRRDPWYNPHFDRLSRPFARLGPPPEA